MRTRNLIMLAVSSAALAVPATASADAPHVVSRGETLTSIAATDGLSISSLAAANGLSTTAGLTVGQVIEIPPRGIGVRRSAPSAVPAPAPTSTSTTGGGYVVRRGDTLSAIAARYGVSVTTLAADNGIAVNGVLLAGRTLSISGAAPPTVATPSTSGGVAPVTVAQPTSEYVTASEVGQIASEYGVSPSLAEAVADQESGFNNDEVSDTGAIGVMQIEPGTWSDLTALGGPALSPDSATDNVIAGVEDLRSLLAATGGDESMAIGAYYQGLSSVRRDGLYPSTQAYVDNVEALQDRFGG